jgi:hypothetical protein
MFKCNSKMFRIEKTSKHVVQILKTVFSLLGVHIEQHGYHGQGPDCTMVKIGGPWELPV